MKMAEELPGRKHLPRCAAILELVSRGSGGQFDEAILSELFEAGLIEVRPSDRRIVLTERGDLVYSEILKFGQD